MNKLIFTKYSNERAKRFALRTDIVQGEKCKSVKKTALYPQGAEHIYRISQWYEKLSRLYSGSRLGLNRCGMQQDGLMLEYLEGDTLEHVLDGYLLEGKISQLTDCLFEYLEEVKKGFTQEKFLRTSEFVKVFGEETLPEDLLSGDVVNIDMVLNNVLVNQGWTLIDYEWTFGFSIPYHFVVYRILNYYLHGSTTRNPLLELNLMEKAGLTQEEIAVFERMEQHFQEVYVLTDEGEEHHVPIRFLYDDISPGTVALKDLGFADASTRGARLVQLYQGKDGTFTEEDSEKKECYKEGIFLDGFSVDGPCSSVRLDPASQYCQVRKLQMQWGEEIKSYRTNGISMADGSLLFPVDDPQILVDRVAETEDNFRAYFEIEYLNADEALYRATRALGEVHQKLNQTRGALAQKEQLITEMENTKVWKAYRKLKGQ